MTTLLVRALLTAACAWALSSAPAQAETQPRDGWVNFETAQVSPLALTPDRRLLLVANTAAHAVELFDVSTPRSPRWLQAVSVGLDPVSVRIAPDGQHAWVVNQVSDSISIVHLPTRQVLRSLRTDNEPADVVFARGQAFVSCSDANTVLVFDLANLDAAPRRIAIQGEEPRALAVAPDGSRVYAAIFESGNATTVLQGRASDARNVVSRAEGPYRGQNPPPNSGTSFVPAVRVASNKVPVSLVVRRDADGSWRDDNRRDWSIFVGGALAAAGGRVPGWTLADNDVAIIDTSSLAVRYQTGLMNIAMAIGVNPASGQVSVVGTDAMNHIRWEPNLRGNFLRVQWAGFQPGGSALVRDLNPHLTYTTPNVPATQKALSLGDPRGIAWRASGSQAFVTGMGSNNVAVIDAAGQRVAQFDVGRGPTGIALNDAAQTGYVLNRFDGSVSVIDLASPAQLTTVRFHDPTPAEVKTGRALLYDTRRGSGTGHMACASCHVDGRTDRLSWDLGDPRGQPVTVANASNSTGAPSGTTTVQPMKGPMLTQTLQDITRHRSFHWRGDKPTIQSFAATFVNLQGLDSAPTAAEMQTLVDFLTTIHLPPNPYRTLDNTRLATVTLPDGRVVTSSSMTALRGSNSTGNNCLRCHLQGGSRNPAANQELGQAFVAPSLSVFYKRLGFLPGSASGSLAGAGFFHDGADTVDRAARTNTAERQNDMLAELMSLDGPGPLTGNERRRDVHAGVGWQISLAGPISTAQAADLDRMVRIATGSAHVGLVVKATVGTETRGAYLLPGGLFQADRLADRVGLQQLKDLVTGGVPMQFMLVPKGTEYRLAVDRDFDGLLDTEELDRGSRPDDPSTASSAQACASEGGTCNPGSRAVVRFGSPAAGWQYGVFEGPLACSTASFADPGGAQGSRRCEVVRPL